MKHALKLITVVIAISVGLILQGQPAVYDSGRSLLPFAWAGGMNACQFGELDLNLDGTNDLVVFDRHGNRLMTFLNSGSPGNTDYSWHPEYTSAFPELRSWVVFHDYDHDGRVDLFTYAWPFPGIRVYRNVSSGSLAFEQQGGDFLLSFQGGGMVNILTTDVDYPGIDDIDGDGDTDIVTFWGLGSFVEYHRNQSVELYGTSDSLIFVEETECWGRFAESDESNLIWLDTCQSGGRGEGRLLKGRSRHTGSTFLLVDRDGDGDRDLLLGDVDYPNLVFLQNGGTPADAFIGSYSMNFPEQDKPVNLFAFPVACRVDVNNDGVGDLLVSPFDPSLNKGANRMSCWLYKASVNGNLTDFQFIQNNFLQEDMIDIGSGSVPVLEDWDGDGLADLFIGCRGDYIYSWYDDIQQLHSVYWSRISLFRNSGTATEPEFTRVTDNYAGLQQYHLQGLIPAFADLDGDGDRDLVTGNQDGTLIYLENIAGQGMIPEYSEPLFGYQQIDVGSYSTPAFADLDNDGLTDLVVGEENGNLNWYRNTGSVQQPHFVLQTDSLGGINVTDYNLSYTGHSVPSFYHAPDGSLDLITGSEKGAIYWYRDIRNQPVNNYQPADSLFHYIAGLNEEPNIGIYSSAVMMDLDNNGLPELITGNFSGGLNYFPASLPTVGGIFEFDENFDIQISPNPANGNVTITFDKGYTVTGVTITSLSGQVVRKVRFANTAGPVEVDISGLAPSVYFVLIHDQRGTIGYQKLIVR